MIKYILDIIKWSHAQTAYMLKWIICLFLLSIIVYPLLLRKSVVNYDRKKIKWFIILSEAYIILLVMVTIGCRVRLEDSYYILEVGWRGNIPHEYFENIILFIPFGIIISVVGRQYSFLKRCVSIIGCSLLIEVIQYLFKLGYFETMDLINNFIGGMIGFGLARLSSLENYLRKPCK